MTAFIGLLIYLIIAGAAVALVWYVVDAIPIPNPLGRIIKIVVMVVACVIVLAILLQFAGGSIPSLR
jgi:dolichyl-phosphate-mannose--protein O-mannosyl transferase